MNIGIETIIIVVGIMIAMTLINIWKIKKRKEIRWQRSKIKLEKKKPLTKREENLYWQLKNKLPDKIVMCQVGLSSLIKIKTKNRSEWQSTFNYISRKRCDFLICSKGFEPLVIIELDDQTHNKKKDKERDEFMLRSGLKTIRVKGNNEIEKALEILKNR